MHRLAASGISMVLVALAAPASATTIAYVAATDSLSITSDPGERDSLLVRVSDAQLEILVANDDHIVLGGDAFGDAFSLSDADGGTDNRLHVDLSLAPVHALGVDLGDEDDRLNLVLNSFSVAEIELLGGSGSDRLAITPAGATTTGPFDRIEFGPVDIEAGFEEVVGVTVVPGGTVVPEPSAALLFGAGSVLVLGSSRRRSRSAAA